MFKKILASSLAVLTLSSSGAMAMKPNFINAPVPVAERVRNGALILPSVCMQTRNGAYENLQNLVKALFEAELNGTYEIKYKELLERSGEYYHNSLEEVNYFLQLCKGEDSLETKARRINCFFNLLDFIDVLHKKITLSTRMSITKERDFLLNELQQGSPVKNSVESYEEFFNGIYCFLPSLKFAGVSVDQLLDFRKGRNDDMEIKNQIVRALGLSKYYDLTAFNEACKDQKSQEEFACIEPCDKQSTSESCDDHCAIEPCEEQCAVKPYDEQSTSESCDDHCAVEPCDE